MNSQVKTIISKIKITLAGINGRLNTYKEKFSEIKDTAIKTIQNETHKKTSK